MELQKFTKKDILTKVRKDDKGRLSLTDLYYLTEKKKNTDPSAWLRQDNVKELVDTVANVLNVVSNHIIKTKRGKGGGTYAHRNIFLAYAKYLDAELHVICNEIVFERIEEENNPDIIVDRAIKTYERKGKDPQWIAKRLHAKGIRNMFTQSLSQHGVVKDGYKKCTDAIYMQEIYSDTKNLEIEIGEFVLTGELELEINDTPNSNEAGKWTDEEIISQIFTLKSIYDNEACEELDLSKSDVDVVEAWFKTINIDLCKR